MKRKKGWMLLELLFGMLLMGIVLGACVLGNNAFKDRIEGDVIDIEGERVVRFIQEIREICSQDECEVEIVPDVVRDRFLVMKNGLLMDTFELEEGIDLVAVNKKEEEYRDYLSVTSAGKVTPCTILLESPDDEFIKVTVKVGNSYVQKR